jgi:hypothetical protein
MAFQTTRTDGSAQGTINATWYNDFMQALTGVMNDQPILLYYQPSAGSNPPVLKLRSNGNADLLWFMNSSGTEVAKFASNGIFTTTNQISWNGTLSGSNQIVMKISPTDASTDTWELYYNTSNNLSIYNATTSLEALQIDPSGNVTAGGGFYMSDGFHIKANGNEHEYWTPQSGSAQGHVWITWSGTAKEIPFSVGGQFESAPAYIDNSGNIFGQSVHVLGSLFGSGGVLTIGDHLSLDGGAITSNGAGTLTATTFSGALSGTATNASNVGTIRNGTGGTNVPIYTGTSTPGSPPTGAIWIKA